MKFQPIEVITDVHRFLLFLCGAAGYAFLPGPDGPLLQPVRGRGRQSQALRGNPRRRGGLAQDLAAQPGRRQSQGARHPLSESHARLGG